MWRLKLSIAFQGFVLQMEANASSHLILIIIEMIFEDGYIYSGVVASKGERISAVLVTF